MTEATPIIGIVGWKNSGKTTLAVRLVEEFTRRGLRVTTIKHAHHDFQIDDAATDSARHRRAGAGQVAIVSAKRWALIRELDGAPEPDLVAIMTKLDPCDLIIVEGYKAAAIPKIEARRTATLTHTRLSSQDPLVMAIAADHIVADAGHLPVFNLDDIVALADLITAKVIAPTHVRAR
jgi:molybdopterin-guanine dinucleotide biosynthesis adapter protein